LDAIGNIPLIPLKNRLSQEEGLLVGTSSGANVFAALHIDNGKNRVANDTA
jgi:cysteine synthase